MTGEWIFQGSLGWYNDTTLLFQANSSLNDLQTAWKQSSVFTMDVNSKKVKKISPDKGAYTSPKSSGDGKIVFLGHPTTEYSSVAFDVYLHDGRTKS